MKNITFLSTLLATTFLAGNALAVIASGTDCGLGCSWSVSDAGVLTVTGADGNSRMNDYTEFPNTTQFAPWMQYRQQIQKVVIDDNISYIGKFAFHTLNNVTDLSIGKNVNSISSHAFSFMTGVTKLSIPDSVEIIGESAFSTMTGVTELSIPDSVTNIGGWAFSEMENLQKLSMGKNIASIGTDAFRGMNSLTELNIPDTSLDLIDFTYFVDNHAYDQAALQYEWAQEQYEMYLEFGASEEKAREYSMLDYYETELDAAAEALRNHVASLTINCSGDADVCKQNILNALPQSYKDALGDYEPFIFAGASSGEGDDASALAKKYNGTPLLYGKKIYTVEEAMEATKDGERFHVGLTYK